MSSSRFPRTGAACGPMRWGRSSRTWTWWTWSRARLRTDEHLARHHLVCTLSAWTNEQRVAVKNLQGSIERAEVTPAKALECLDWIANEARLRLAVFVENVLAADTSWMGRRRYSRWQAGKGEKLKD